MFGVLLGSALLAVILTVMVVGVVRLAAISVSGYRAAPRC